MNFKIDVGTSEKVMLEEVNGVLTWNHYPTGIMYRGKVAEPEVRQTNGYILTIDGKVTGLCCGKKSPHDDNWIIFALNGDIVSLYAYELTTLQKAGKWAYAVRKELDRNNFPGLAAAEYNILKQDGNWPDIRLVNICDHYRRLIA